MKMKTALLMTGTVLAACLYAFAGPVGPPSGAPIYNQSNYQPNAVYNVSSGTVLNRMTAGHYYGEGANISGVTASSIAAAGVNAGSLGSGVIASSIAVGAVGTNQLASQAVTAAKVTNNTLTATQMAAGTFGNVIVLSSNVAAGSLGSSVIASSIGVLAVGTQQIANSAVTDAKVSLSTAAIGTGKFGDGQVLISTAAETGVRQIAGGGTGNTTGQAASVASGGVDFSTITSALNTKLSSAAIPSGFVDFSTITSALNSKLSSGAIPSGFVDFSTITSALNSKLSSGAIPSGFVDFSTITSALNSKLSSGAVPSGFVNLSTVTTWLQTLLTSGPIPSGFVNLSTVTNAVFSISTNNFVGGFNGASQLLQLTSGGVFPALNGAALTNISASTIAASGVNAGTLGASVIASSVAATGVAPGSYGDATHTSSCTYASDGRASACANVLITGAAPTGAASGVLAGNFPNPTFAAAVILSSHIANGAVGDAQTNLSTASISTGKFPDTKVSITTGAFLGGFNAASKLVQLDASALLPAVNGSALTSLTAANISGGTLGSTVIASSVAATGVAPATYGSTTQLPQIAVTSDGRITSAGNVTITPSNIGAAASGANSDITSMSALALVSSAETHTASMSVVAQALGGSGGGIFSWNGTSVSAAGALTTVNQAITNFNGRVNMLTSTMVVNAGMVGFGGIPVATDKYRTKYFYLVPVAGETNMSTSTILYGTNVLSFLGIHGYTAQQIRTMVSADSTQCSTCTLTGIMIESQENGQVDTTLAQTNSNFMIRWRQDLVSASTDVLTNGGFDAYGRLAINTQGNMDGSGPVANGMIHISSGFYKFPGANVAGIRVDGSFSQPVFVQGPGAGVGYSSITFMSTGAVFATPVTFSPTGETIFSAPATHFSSVTMKNIGGGGFGLTATSSFTIQSGNAFAVGSTMTVPTTGQIGAPSQVGAKAQIFNNITWKPTTAYNIFWDTATQGADYNRANMFNVNTASDTFKTTVAGIYYTNCHANFTNTTTPSCLATMTVSADGTAINISYGTFSAVNNNTIEAAGFHHLAAGQAVTCKVSIADAANGTLIGSSSGNQSVMSVQLIWGD